MISIVVLTKNEEENIKECLAGLGWADEILVIDDNSTDKTREIAKKQGARVLKHELKGDFSQQRNFGLEQAKHDWLFFVDADERVNPELAKEIQIKTKASPSPDGFYLKRIDFFANQWLKHGEIGSLKILRLAKRGQGKWKRKVDEKWEIKGKTETLKNPLLHYAHPSVAQFLKSINEKSSLNAQAFYQEGQRLKLGEWLKPLAKFIHNFVFRLGFLDGVAGFVFAVLMSLHSFLVRGKLYLLWRREGGWR